MVYTEDAINAIEKEFGDMFDKSDDCRNKTKSDYQGYTNHGLLTNTMKEIDKSVSSVSNLAAKAAQSFYKHGNEMFDFDRKSAVEIETLNIPQDFVGNNSMEINYYNASILSKIDGKSVNDGKSTNEQEYDDSSAVAAESLFDMNKNKITEENEYDDTTIIGKSILGKVDGGTTNQKDLDDSTSIGNTNLKQVQGGQTNAQNYNDSISINNVNVGNVNNTSNDDEKKQGFDESTIVGESILGSAELDGKTSFGANPNAAFAAAQNLDISTDSEIEKDA